MKPTNEQIKTISNVSKNQMDEGIIGYIFGKNFQRT